MTTPTTPPATPTPRPASVERIRKIYDSYTGLYAPSVIEEAAQLLDELLAVAHRHGHTDPRSDAAGWLAQAAAEAVSTKYRRPDEDRTAAELAQAWDDLTAAFTTRGLTTVPSRGPRGVAVAPIPPGPAWGYGTGLAVALYADSGWDLMVNQPSSRVYAIHAPVTAAGAAEVAELVHGVLTGRIPDPFRRP